MPKVNLPTIESGYLSTEALNQAFADIVEAFENTLSRDGTAPNQLEADLDLNGYRVINTGSGDDDSSLITRGEMEEYVDGRAGGIVLQHQESQTSSNLQTVFTLTTMEYEPGAYNLAVYVDGVRKFSPVDYVETDSTTITFTAGQALGADVQFVTNEFLGNITLPNHTHTWSQLTNIPVYATRWPDWSEVSGKPTTFEATAHNHAASEITSGRLADARRGVHVQSTEPTANTVGELWIW